MTNVGMNKPYTVTNVGMNKTYTSAQFPFAIERDCILKTLDLTAREVADMISAGTWNPAFYDQQECRDAAEKLDGQMVLVTQVARTEDAKLCLGIVGWDEDRIRAFITFDPCDWRRMMFPTFYKESDGSLWMRAEGFDHIKVESICSSRDMWE